MRVCSFSGCPREHAARGWCNSHYRQWRQGGPVRPLKEPRSVAEPPCKYAGCDATLHYAKGWCKSHYLQSWYGFEIRPVRRKTGIVASPNEDGEKQCARCRLWKPAEEYHPASKPGRLQSKCKRCERDARFQAVYNVDILWYEDVLRRQGGCGICGKVDGEDKYLSVDHDHSCCPGDRSCGICVRGLLCSRHNRALGLLGDSVESVKKALIYLEES